MGGAAKAKVGSRRAHQEVPFGPATRGLSSLCLVPPRSPA